VEIKCKLIKELDNGSAIVSIEMDEEAKDWLIGEGFTVVLQESLKNSKTYISPADVKKAVAKKSIPKKGKVVPKKGMKKSTKKGN
jgi:hypothetical protein